MGINNYQAVVPLILRSSRTISRRVLPLRVCKASLRLNASIDLGECMNTRIRNYILMKPREALYREAAAIVTDGFGQEGSTKDLIVWYRDSALKRISDCSPLSSLFTSVTIPTRQVRLPP